MQRRRSPPAAPISSVAEMEARRHLSESLGRFFLRDFPHHSDPKLQFPPEHHAEVKKHWILRFLHLIKNVDLREVERHMADDVDGRLAVLQYVSEPWRDRTDVPKPHPAQTYERLVFVQTEMDLQAHIAVLRRKREERGELRTREATPSPRLKRKLYKKGWDENEAQRVDYDVDEEYKEESPAPETLKIPKPQAAAKVPFDVMEISDSSSEESPPPEDAPAPARRMEQETLQADDDSQEHSQPTYIPTPPDPQTEAEISSVEDPISEGSPSPQAPKQQAFLGGHVNSKRGPMLPVGSKDLAALVKVHDRAVTGGKKPRMQTNNRNLDNSEGASSSESESTDGDDSDLIFLGERLSYGGKRLPRKVPEGKLTDGSEVTMDPEQTRLSYGGKTLPPRAPECEIMDCSEATKDTAQHVEGLPSEYEAQHVDPVSVHSSPESGFSSSTNIIHPQSRIRLPNNAPDKDVVVDELDKLFKYPRGVAITARHSQAEDTITVSNIVEPPSPELQDIPIGIAASNESVSGPTAENYHLVPEPIPPKRQLEQQVTSNTRSESGPPTTPRPMRARRVTKETATPWTLASQQPKWGALPQNLPQKTPARPPMIKMQDTLVVAVKKQPLTPVQPSEFYLQQTPRALQTQPITPRGNLGPLTNKPPRYEFSPEKYPTTSCPDIPSFTPINRAVSREPVGRKRKMQEEDAPSMERAGPRLKIGRRKLTPEEVQMAINAPSTESSLASTASEPDESIITID